MNCDTCRWFNKTGFAPGFGDCVLNREVHSSNHESCEHYEECEPRQHGAGMRKWGFGFAFDMELDTPLDFFDVVYTNGEKVRYDKRPHGELKPYKDSAYSGGGYWLCTKCQYRFSFGAYRILNDDNYCPHCGAKIRKEEDNK